MAKKLYEESNIQAIADAIRNKRGTSKTYKTSEMAAAIAGITTGDGSGNCTSLHLPEEALTLPQSCTGIFANNAWNWFIEEYGDKIITYNIYPATQMFKDASLLTDIPFDLNFADILNTDSSEMFYGCGQLTHIGKIINWRPSNIKYLFMDCKNLRYLPEMVNFNFSKIQTDSSAYACRIFKGCRSLRSVPENVLKEIYGTQKSSSYCHLSYMFNECNSLDEIIGLSPKTGVLTSNIFSTGSYGTFYGCSRIKNLIFDTDENGNPYTANWSAQIIDLTNYVGYAMTNNLAANFNSGITLDKQVVDDETYQALKDDPDWFTISAAYSRYNHDSAVATINSLPDTSAYLATVGGTNTIKFKGASGAKTDGGAISNLTAEEIAVATAKGWTVEIV
jgi:hypothetical protein